MLIPATDIESYNLFYHFSKTNEWIDKSLEKTNVLVHCQAGMSRSATIVIAYFMRKYKWGVYKTLEFVKDKRKIVAPNKGFIKQLHAYSD